MITDPTELAVQRALTAAFVDANFETIVLTPRTRVKTTTGGIKFTDQAPRAPQRFHVVETNSRAAVNPRVQGGSQDETQFSLVGYWDAQVAVHDRFVWNGEECEVAAVELFNGYEQRAVVNRYGR